MPKLDHHGIPCSKRYYSVFEKQDGKWVRITPVALRKPSAVYFFQDLLLGSLAAGTSRSLRPVPSPYSDE